GSRVSAKAGVTLRSSAETRKPSMEMSGTETVQAGCDGGAAPGAGAGAAVGVAPGPGDGAGGAPEAGIGAVDCALENGAAFACVAVSSRRLIELSAPRQARTPPPAARTVATCTDRLARSTRMPWTSMLFSS